MSETRDPQVSVIIPAHNVAKYLGRSLGSIRDQTFRQHETIVVDDASDDDPAAQIGATYPPARYIRLTRNLGVSAARNAGIRAARGTYVALLDADDSWAPDKLERQLDNVAKDPGIDIVFSDFAHVMPDGSPGPWQGGTLEKLRNWGITSRLIASDAYELGGPIAFELIKRTSFMHPSTIIIRRVAFERFGYFDEQLRGAEDLQMLIRLASHCRIAYVDRVLTYVEQRPDSLKHNALLMAENMLRLYTSLHKRRAEMPDDVTNAVRMQLATTHDNLAWIHYSRGNVRLSRSHYISALQNGPTLGGLLHLAKTFLPAPIVSALRRARDTARQSR